MTVVAGTVAEELQAHVLTTVREEDASKGDMRFEAHRCI
jgi:hypothetical protein